MDRRKILLFWSQLATGTLHMFKGAIEKTWFEAMHREPSGGSLGLLVKKLKNRRGVLR